MDKFKPEDDLKADAGDRHSGRSRQQDAYDNEPQLNIGDINIDDDDRRGRQSQRTREDDAESYAAEPDEALDAEDRRPRGRKKAVNQKSPASRQYLMMGTGILVLLLLIFGIGSALKSPDTTTADASPGAEKSIDLSSSQSEGSAPSAPAADSPSQDLSMPAVSSTPTQAASVSQPEGQQRVELQGDLGSALTEQQNQAENSAARSTLPVAAATVAPVAGGKAAPESRSERKTAIIEPVKKSPVRSHTTETKPAPVKRSEPTHVAAAQTKPARTAEAPVAKAPAAKAPVVQAPSGQAKAVTQSKPAAAAAPAASGQSQALKNAAGSSYTLQLNASSNSANLNAWAKKQNLQNYTVYQTSRNGQPWYVMVSGIYANKTEAEKAISSLPAGVQSNKPWTKPMHQVQSEIK